MVIARYMLPFPPSLNNLFANVAGQRGRFPSRRYTAWRKAASLELLLQRPKRYPVRADVLVELCPPDKRERDSDNYTKAPLDALVRAGILADDSRSFVRSSMAVFVENGPPCRVTLSPASSAERG